MQTYCQHKSPPPVPPHTHTHTHARTHTHVRKHTHAHTCCCCRCSKSTGLISPLVSPLEPPSLPPPPSDWLLRLLIPFWLDGVVRMVSEADSTIITGTLKKGRGHTTHRLSTSDPGRKSCSHQSEQTRRETKVNTCEDSKVNGVCLRVHVLYEKGFWS